MKEKQFDFRFIAIATGFWFSSVVVFAYTSNSTHWLFLVLTFITAINFTLSNKKLFVICIFLGLAITTVRYYWLHQADVRISNLSYQTHSFAITSDPEIVDERFTGALSFSKDLFVYADIQDLDFNLPIALTIDDSNSELATALPSSVWQCRMKLTPSDANRRYIAFATCLDEPKLVASENHLQSIAGSFRNTLKELTYLNNTSEAATLLPGLVVGDNQAQSKQLILDLRLAGLGHLTAVSGANVAILLLFVQFSLQRTQLSDKWRFFILLGVLVAFVIVARPSPSVVRAAMMAAITLVYWIKGLQKLSEGILFLAIASLLLIDPWLAISWGFALSAAATLGLILLPRLWGVDEKSSLVVKLASTTLAASIATMPILIAMGSPVTFATIPANIIAEFMVAPATVLGLLAPLIFHLPFLGFLSQYIANCAIGCAAVIVAVAKFFSNSIFAINIVSIKGISLVVFLVLAYKFRSNYKSLIGLGFVAVLLFSGYSHFENRWQINNWEIAVCDIGQGDATLIRTGENSALVVDSGPDPNLMKTCLKDFGIEQIDLFVASHFHADHVGGIDGLVEIARPIRVITASLSAPLSGVTALERAISPVKREIAKVGMQGNFDSDGYTVTWQVLAPASAPLYVDESNGSLINNNSVVLLIMTSHHRLLLTGDVEIDGQETLMRSISNPNADIVKVPHHGSAYQSPTFAQWVSAELAWISVAKDNTYGHPNATTILLYKNAGTLVLTTMDCGHIAIGKDAYSTSHPCV